MTDARGAGGVCLHGDGPPASGDVSAAVLGRLDEHRDRWRTSNEIARGGMGAILDA